VIKKRFQTFVSQTEPVKERFASEGILRTIDAERSIDAVWEDTRIFFA
jgi:adenylate kinase family enzyme